MSFLGDYVPWWVWLMFSTLGIGGGLAALIFFVPAALPVLLSIWNRCPLWLKAVLVGITGGVFAYLAGRNAGSRNERARMKEKEDSAVRDRLEVKRETQKKTPSQVDEELDRHGDFRD